MLLGGDVGLGPVDIVLDGGSSSPPPKGHSPPQFPAHVCCGQAAGCIKMSLVRVIGLGPGHIVLDWTQLPIPERGTAPNFRSMSIVAKQSPI